MKATFFIIILLGISTLILLIPSATSQPRGVTGITAHPAIFSPNGDGDFDTTEIIVRADNDQELVVNIYDNAGKSVLRDLWVDQIESGVYRAEWNGSGDKDAIVADDVYEIRVSTSGAQGEEDGKHNATVRVHNAPLDISFFTEPGDPIPANATQIKGNVRIELTSGTTQAEPQFKNASFDYLDGEEWIRVAMDEDPSNGWSVFWNVSNLRDDIYKIRGTLHGPDDFRVGNITSIELRKARDPSDPGIELSEIITSIATADDHYPDLIFSTNITNLRIDSVPLVVVFSTDVSVFETTFVTIDGFALLDVAGNWKRDPFVSEVTIEVYHQGKLLDSVSKPLTFSPEEKDGSEDEPEDNDAILTEEDIPMVAAGVAGSALILSGISYGFGLKRCLKLSARSRVSRRKSEKDTEAEDDPSPGGGAPGEQYHEQDHRPKGENPEGDLPVMFNPVEVNVKKTVPWNEQKREGKGDDSVPNLEFTETGIGVRKQRYVCEKCGKVINQSFHNCGYCGGLAIPVTQGSSPSTSIADEALAPNRHPHERNGLSGDEDHEVNDGDKDDDED